MIRFRFQQAVNESVTGAATGFVIGSGVALAQGENFGDAMNAGGTNALQGLSHGVMQGGMSALQGGDFWQGMATGTISSWASAGFNASPWGGSDFGQVAFSAVAGGITATATGGNFWEGAATGLTISLLNDLMHQEPKKESSGSVDELIKEFNDYASAYNDITEMASNLYESFTGKELSILRKLRFLNDVLGDAMVLGSSYDLSERVANGESWDRIAGGALNVTEAALSNYGGPIGAMGAISIGSYRAAGSWLINTVQYINSNAHSMWMNEFKKSYGW